MRKAKTFQIDISNPCDEKWANMTTTKGSRHCIIIILIMSTFQLAFGQIGNQGYEKIITTIEFFGNTADTSIITKNYDVNKKLIQDVPKNVSFPIRADTNKISNEITTIEYTWQDKLKSFYKEINTTKEVIKIGIDKNGRDTIYLLSFKLGKKGNPIKGIIINNGDTTKYKIEEKFTLNEIHEIHSNIIRESEFINFTGNVQFKNKRQISIIDSKDRRNEIEIILNRNLKPTKVIKRQYHNYHKMVFTNKYYYKYDSDKLVEIKNIDDYGDIEMIRRIEYKLR